MNGCLAPNTPELCTGYCLSRRGEHECQECGHSHLCQRAHPLCGCRALLHGIGGCTQPAGTYEGEQAPCMDCASYEAIGLHGSQVRRGMARNVLHGGYTREEWDSMASDAELRHDEFGGISEGELREMYGK